ncbi:MAG: molecular chaperone TorD family protein [Planctomycetota bacterium]|nr:molecular chaperone TorD family protein [Planctomycetota bacterium]
MKPSTELTLPLVMLFHMDITNPQEGTLARAGLYGFYSGVLLSEFDPQTLETLQAADWQETLAALGIEPPTGDEQTCEEFAVDYCKIFVGPQNFCPPYQSIWESGRFQSHVINSMNDFLEVVQTNSRPEIKDHAGHQFELMAIILHHEAGSVDPALDLSKAFFRNHVFWTGQMFSRAAGLAETRFYRDLLLAGEQFIQMEKQHYNLNTAN